MAGQVPLGRRESLTLLSPQTHCRDFLPRGSGIVTRRPLVLQLVNATTGTCPPAPAVRLASPALHSTSKEGPASPLNELAV